MPSYLTKLLSATAAIYLIGQQVQCPMLAIPAVADAAIASSIIIEGGLIITAIVCNTNADCRKESTSQKFTTHNMKSVSSQIPNNFTAPPAIPQQNFDLCYKDLGTSGAKVNFTGPVQNNGVQIDGLPPTCMVLAGVINGVDDNGPVPTPCGSACILYNNLNDTGYEVMRNMAYNLVALSSQSGGN
ncbi:hypothetical protein QBC38DRAFT_255057 [Podospora fimiseda]|uniref:Uncharacterized protein n=1 Tax=Podospora fimiseda TaxID=252190 RepID=A0AAN7BLV4_9PEZI|nr:hypothetical protein QBC38DRAFT_255057 [Podospora fimiseda]